MTNDIIQQRYPADNLSDGIVGWTGQDDCDNPRFASYNHKSVVQNTNSQHRNFSSTKKLKLLGLVSFMSFLRYKPTADLE